MADGIFWASSRKLTAVVDAVPRCPLMSTFELAIPAPSLQYDYGPHFGQMQISQDPTRDIANKFESETSNCISQAFHTFIHKFPKIQHCKPANSKKPFTPNSPWLPIPENPGPSALAPNTPNKGITKRQVNLKGPRYCHGRHFPNPNHD